MLQVRTACPGHDLRQVARRDADQPHQFVLSHVEPVQKLSHPVRLELYPMREGCLRSDSAYRQVRLDEVGLTGTVGSTGFEMWLGLGASPRSATTRL